VEPGLSGYRSIIIDWLGCGFSDRPEHFGYTLEDHAATVSALLDHLHLGANIIVGHSMGGAVAIALADQRPDLVAQLILAEANLNAGGGSFSSSIARQTEEEFVKDGYLKLLQGYQTRAIEGDLIAATLLGVFRVSEPFALHRSAVGLVQGTKPVMRELLFQLSMPVMYVAGEQSLPDPDFDMLRAKGYETGIVPDAGHRMVSDNPSGFAEVVGSFLSS
jgi:pimeloyl-ACP methyl ester carboxylesterase